MPGQVEQYSILTLSLPSSARVASAIVRIRTHIPFAPVTNPARKGVDPRLMIDDGTRATRVLILKAHVTVFNLRHKYTHFHHNFKSIQQQIGDRHIHTYILLTTYFDFNGTRQEGIARYE